MARRMKHRRSTTGDGGFTLLELLVTLTIASMMLAIGIPRLTDTVARARLVATADKVAALLRQTRASAMRTSMSSKVSLDRSHRSCTAIGKTFRAPEDELITLLPFNSSNQVASDIEFLSDGSSSGGKFMITSGRRSVAIDVDWLTGRVTVRD